MLLRLIRGKQGVLGSIPGTRRRRFANRETARRRATGAWLEALDDGEKGRSHIEGARVLNGPPSAADGRRAAIVLAVPGARLSLIEFPADDPERARRFWAALLGTALEPRHEGEGWQTHSATPPVGVHARGRGPGDSFSLPYFAVDDLAEALEQVEALGGSVVHPGSALAVCKDSEGSPFGLALTARG